MMSFMIEQGKCISQETDKERVYRMKSIMFNAVHQQEQLIGKEDKTNNNLTNQINNCKTVTVRKPLLIVILNANGPNSSDSV